MKRLVTIAGGAAVAFSLVSASADADAKSVKRDLTTPVVKSAKDLKKAPSNMAKHKAPPAPKDVFIAFPRRDPNPVEAMEALRAGHATGIWPGYLIATAMHESAGTMHPEIRPGAKDGTATRVTTTGKVVGNPTSSAAGFAQFTEGTWLTTTKTHGAEIADAAGLSVSNPAADRLLRERHDQKALLALRSDPTAKVPMMGLGYFSKDNAATIKNVGVPLNPTTLYIMHFSGSVDLLKKVTSRSSADYVPGEDAKHAAAVDANKSVFTKTVLVKDEEGVTQKVAAQKTGDEFYEQKKREISEAHVVKYERQLYGINYSGFDDGHSAKGKSASQLRRELVSFHSVQGHEVKLPESKVLQALTPDEKDRFRTRFISEVEQHGNKGQTTLTPDENKWLVASLKRQSVLPPDSQAKELGDPFVKNALAAYRERVGLKVAPGDVPVLTAADKVSLGIYNERIEALAKPQIAQKQALAAGGAVDLQKLRKLPATHPEVQLVRPEIVALKETLAKQGLYAYHTHKEHKQVVDKRGHTKKQTITVRDAFDGTVDTRLIEAYSTAQLKSGLRETGQLDRVSLHIIKGEPLAALPAMQPQPVRPAQAVPVQSVQPAQQQAPTPVQRESRGTIGGPRKPFNDKVSSLGFGDVSLAALESVLQTAVEPQSTTMRAQHRNPKAPGVA